MREHAKKAHDLIKRTGYASGGNVAQRTLSIDEESAVPPASTSSSRMNQESNLDTRDDSHLWMPSMAQGKAKVHVSDPIRKVTI